MADHGQRSAVKRTLTLFAAVALLLNLLFSSHAAAQQLSMTGALELTQNYRPNAWQPVRLELRNPSDRAIEGSAALPLSDEKAPAMMKLPVNVPAHSVVRLSVSGYFPRIEPSSKKKQAVPALSVAEWRDAAGGLLSRTPIIGLPLSAKDQGVEEKGQIVLLISQRTEPADENGDLDALLSRLSEASQVPLTVAAIAPDALARQAEGLHAIKAIVLQGVDPEAIDVGQREALMEYVRGGGLIVLAGPVEAVGRNANWLDPLLPVRMIGTRTARAVEIASGAAPLKLRAPIEIVEAIEGVVELLLRGKDYVHVAARPLGLGRIVFTSFAINALDESQTQGLRLSEQLLDLRNTQSDLARTQLAEARHQVLGSMLGRK